MGQELSDGAAMALETEERNNQLIADEMGVSYAQAEAMIEEARKTGPSFDPTSKFITLNGRGGSQMYLEVKWRIVWFREDWPHGQIVSELIFHQKGEAIFKATVSDGEGGVAVGHGSETQTDFRDYLEKAETKAIGRALAALGYGTPGADHEMGMSLETRQFVVVDAPIAAPSRPTSRASGAPPAIGGNASADATPYQIKTIASLRQELALVTEDKLAWFLKDHNIAYNEGEPLTKAKAGMIVNALQEHKAKNK